MGNSKTASFLGKTLGRKNKKAMSISIVLLVAMTLILVIMTIAYFVISENGRSSTLNIPIQLDSVYSDSNYFNFYFGSAFQRAADGFGPGEGTDVFLGKLRDELDKTSFISSGFSQIEYGPLNESLIEISNDKVALNLDVDVNNNQYSDSGGLNIKYSYVKRFEAKLG